MMSRKKILAEKGKSSIFVWAVALFGFLLIFASATTIVSAASSNISSSSPSIAYGDQSTGLGVLHHFTFSGTSTRTGNLVISAGQFFYYTTNRFSNGGASGYGQAIDNQSGKDGFTFKFVKLQGQNSICSQKDAINLNAVVTHVRGDGLRLVVRSSVAILLRCFSPNSITIVSPACTAGVPACLVATIYEDTFFGTLKIS
jgi:hypothetical protein